jgi:hypothetical protein
MGREGVHWIDLNQDRDKWRAVASTLFIFGSAKTR